jgi:hypothetical protein
MNAEYFRALASRCRRSAHSCFDLYAKEEFGRLASQFEIRASELDAAGETSWSIASTWRRSQLRGSAGDH